MSGGLPDQAGEQVLLEFDALGPVLLHDIGVPDGFCDIGGEVHAVGQAVGFQALGRQLRDEFGKRLVGRLLQVGAGIADMNGEAMCGEQCCPGQTDGARADHGGGTEGACHHPSSFRWSNTGSAGRT